MKGDEKEEASDVSESEALEILLGGLGVGDLSMAAWDSESVNEEEESVNEEDDPAPGLTTKTANSTGYAPMPILKDTQQFAPATPSSSFSSLYDSEIFRRAYLCLGYCTRDGRVERPPVRIVDTGDTGRGNIAVATRAIRTGETIFTERAASAALLHPPHPGNDNNYNKHPRKGTRKNMRACPHCFRSLEPAASCAASSEHPSIPLPHLWPVADYDEDAESLQAVKDDDNDHQALFQDTQRRLFCRDCNVWFCNRYCLQAHQQDTGVAHCVVQSIWKALPDIDTDVQPAVILATRLFVQLLHHYRKTGRVEGTFLDGLCGKASDVRPLELGVQVERNDDESSSSRYSLQPFYNLLVEQLRLTGEERTILDVTVLDRLAAISARNSVGFRTQSPFKSYYAALLRRAGGWGSEKHEMYMKQLAKSMGRGDSELDRNMDFEIEERVAPAVAGLFTLTARLNHSCAPNAAVQSQVFMDCHVDVVAVQDIARDEEITISYLGPVRNTPTTRRRRELRAKYLFECACPLCTAPSTATGAMVHGCFN